MTRSAARIADSPATGEIGLSDEQRDSLLDQLFAMHARESPDASLCFCGSDGDLVEAVTAMRARLERELGDEEPEL